MSTSVDTVIVITTGKQDRGTRATLAAAWGCATLAMGRSVSIYLTMDGTVWAMQGAAKHVQVGGFETLDVYLEQFLELGGKIQVCAPCSEYYCAVGPETAGGTLLNEAELTGLASIVARVGPDTQVVTF